jgi:PrcB C-terminal
MMMNALMAAALVVNVAFVSIDKGDASEQQTARQAIARTAAEWQALWRAHAPNGKLPVVDFTTKMVVGVFLGTKPSDGYEVEIVNVKTDGDALVVEFVQRQPKRGMMAAQILTQPFHLIAVPRHADPVRFVQVADPAPPPAPTQR